MASHYYKTKFISDHVGLQSTVLKADANRQAKADSIQDLEALAAYANLGDTPDSWDKFHLVCPEFFPHSRIERLYYSAKAWVRLYGSAEHHQALNSDAGPIALPPLLWLRNLLRTVWTRKDAHGAALCVLLGFQKQARSIGLSDVAPISVWRLAYVPGQPVDIDNLDEDLPPGQPIVDPGTHTIRWEFGCQFQRAVYALMENFWLAKVCPQCGKYFIAGKTAQKFCSLRCFGDKKTSASLDFYHRKGKYLREQQRDLRKRSVSKGKR